MDEWRADRKSGRCDVWLDKVAQVGVLGLGLVWAPGAGVLRAAVGVKSAQLGTTARRREKKKSLAMP